MKSGSPAFKEWSAVVEALGAGEQIIILRKGGIAEGPGGFKVNADRFWLYPTFFHAQLEKSKASAAKWFSLAEKNAPPLEINESGVSTLPSVQRPRAPTRDAASPLTLRYFAKVESAAFVPDWDRIQSLDNYHLWSSELVRERFHWSQPPGLHVIEVRVHRLDTGITLTPTPAMSGCKSWVEMPFAIDDYPSHPVLTDEAFTQLQSSLGKV